MEALNNPAMVKMIFERMENRTKIYCQCDIASRRKSEGFVIPGRIKSMAKQ